MADTYSGLKTRLLVAGNWKMNTTAAEARSLIRDILEKQPEVNEAQLALFPPFTFLREAAELLKGSPISLGAQNLFWEDRGAFTGEISAPMLKDAGCEYVIIGHSERRKIIGETDKVVNLKLKAALRAGIKPILCLGETLEQREVNATEQIISEQLILAFKDLSKDEVSSTVIAYEPVWAIGTGRTATPEQAQAAHAFLRALLERNYGNSIASRAIIIYGGSVKPDNAFSLYREKDVDGFLAGGASLNSDSFIDIAREALKYKKEEKWAR